MTTPDRLIAEVIEAAGGSIIGRIRLQKVFYLLEQAGMGSGLAFHYHHYGPYSRDLDEFLARAQALQGVQEDIKYRRIDGMPYSVFSLAAEQPLNETGKLGRLRLEKAQQMIRAMKSRTLTELELAATIHWLAKKEKVADWKKELVRRKGVKAEQGRIELALGLLKEFGLTPA